MQKITVNTAKPYDVMIGCSILAQCGDMIARRVAPCKAAIITDDAVNVLYAPAVEKSLNEAGFESCKIVFSHGETNKNIDTLAYLLDSLAQNRITRGDLIIALGGGVVGDIAGFAAAVYLRGIRFVQIPTTFLAAIDSSVGGKTGVDLAEGKNLAGAFWQPEMVICDVDAIKTLPMEYFLDGVGETIKYGFAFDKELVDILETKDIIENISDITYRCIDIKRRVVEADERDNGERRKLNFGHTIGHAIEQCSKFTISHGHAVGIGMVIITRACVKKGLLHAEVLDRLISIMGKCSLPTGCGYSAYQLSQKALNDKKRRGDNISIIIPTDVGECVVKKIEVSQLADWIAQGL